MRLLAPYYDRIRLRSERYVEKTTLGHVRRIEALRWKALLYCERNSELWDELVGEIFHKHDGEAFIPDECYEIYRLSEETEESDGRPRRIFVRKEVGVGFTLSYDDRYWDYQEPRPICKKAAESNLGQIAEAGALGEWEQITLPSRVASVTEEKLALGRRYFHLEWRGRRRYEHVGFFSELLSHAVRFTGILPKVERLTVDRIAKVEINGRLYYFKIKGPDYVEPFSELWPRPNDLPVVAVPESFGFDESLLGLSLDNILTRFGEPTSSFGFTWCYPQGALVFSDGPHYRRTVEKVELCDQG